MDMILNINITKVMKYLKIFHTWRGDAEINKQTKEKSTSLVAFNKWRGLQGLQPNWVLAWEARSLGH